MKIIPVTWSWDKKYNTFPKTKLKYYQVMMK
jgi:hypothetical protein